MHHAHRGVALPVASDVHKANIGVAPRGMFRTLPLSEWSTTTTRRSAVPALTITLDVLLTFATIHQLAPDTPILVRTNRATDDGSQACEELMVSIEPDGTAALIVG